MSKIKRITVTNLKAVSSQTANFNGCTAIVTAGNNKGKTSFLRSLTDRLRGLKPEQILKQGEREGSYEMELTSGERFLWKFDTKKEKLSFITERDIKMPCTKEICATYFPKVFDIDKFLTDSPKEQTKALAKLSDIDLDQIDKEYKIAYEERTFAKRRMDEELIKHQSNLVDPDIKEEGDESYKQIEQEINSAALHNERMKNFAQKIADKKIAVETNKRIIEKLLIEIKATEDANMELENNIDVGEAELKKPERQLKTQEYIDSLSKKVAVIKKENEIIVINNKAKEQKKEYEKALKNWEDCDKEVKQIEEDKADAIRSSSLPEGFGFNNEGITYNGFAFNKESLSSSAIYIAALKLASVGLGDVKCLHFDASFLDKNSLTEIEKWAKTQKLQLLIERADYEGGEIEYEIIQDAE